MRLVVAASCLLLLLHASSAAWADDVTSGATQGPNGDPVVFVGTPGSNAPGGPSGGHGSVTCGLFEITGVAGAGVTLGVGGGAIDPVEGRPYFIVCRNVDGTVVYQQLITY